LTAKTHCRIVHSKQPPEETDMPAFASLRTLAPLCAGAILIAASAFSGAKAEERPYFSWNGDPRVPACEDVAVQNAVAGRVARADVEYGRGLTIRAMERIVETGFSVNRPSPYARRFCEARAAMSDGRERRVYYAIMEHAGFVGLGWKTEACVAGVDPWRVYDARCRTVRP
jgi:hypothetical protein